MAGTDTSEELTKTKLQSAEAVLSLGLIVVKQLQQKGIVTIFINADGKIEFCPFGEIELDGMSQDDALGILLDRGYTDEQLMAYLNGRKSRETHGKDL